MRGLVGSVFSVIPSLVHGADESCATSFVRFAACIYSSLHQSVVVALCVPSGYDALSARSPMGYLAEANASPFWGLF